MCRWAGGIEEVGCQFLNIHGLEEGGPLSLISSIFWILVLNLALELKEELSEFPEQNLSIVGDLDISRKKVWRQSGTYN